MSNTVFEDVISEAKSRIRIRDRIILVLCTLLILLATVTAYLGYQLYYKTYSHKEVIRNRVEKIEVCENLINQSNTGINKRRKKVAKKI